MAKRIDQTIINSFQFQIYQNADSRFLMTLEDASKVSEIKNPQVINKIEVSEGIKDNQTGDGLDSVSEKIESIESKSSMPIEEPASDNKPATSFKEMLNEFSETENENVYGQNTVSFQQLETPDHYFGIQTDRWIKISIEEKSSYPKILFLGDPDSEGILNNEEEYDDEKFHLLIKIAKATKIPLTEFGFINCISQGQKSFSDSVQLGGLLTVLKPEYIITLGADAYKFMTGNRARLSSVHGKTEEILFSRQGGNQHRIKILPTFHPQYILINPSIKKTVWSDFQKLIETFSA